MRFLLPVCVLLCLLALAFAHDEKEIKEEQVIALVQLTAKNIRADAASTLHKIAAGYPPFKDTYNSTLYVFVYDENVNMVAHPDTNLMGHNFKGRTDVRGVQFRDEIVKRALSKGEGWTEYHYSKPGEMGIFPKKTYCEKVIGSDRNTYIIACGKYQ